MARKSKSTSPWAFTVKMGLLAGVIALYIALTGMVLSLSQRPVIGTVLTLGHLLYLMIFAYMAYWVALRSPLRQQIWPPIVQGMIVGGLGAALLALLPIIGQKVDLSFIFVTAKPTLYKLLSFGKDPLVAFWLLTGLGAAVGAAFGLLAVLPEFLRKAIFWAINITILLGLLSDLARSTVLKWVIGDYFAYKGLKPDGAAKLFLILSVLLTIWFFLRSLGVVDEIRRAYQQDIPASVRRFVMSIALGAFLLTRLLPAEERVPQQRAQPGGPVHHHGPGLEHRGWVRRSARLGLRRVLRDRRVHGRAANLDRAFGPRLELLASPALGRALRAQRGRDFGHPRAADAG